MKILDQTQEPNLRMPRRHVLALALDLAAISRARQLASEAQSQDRGSQRAEETDGTDGIKGDIEDE